MLDVSPCAAEEAMAVRMSDHLFSVNAELRYQPVRLRVRALLGDDVVADSRAALLVWEPGRIVPMYAVPQHDLVHGAEPSAGQPRIVSGDAPVGVLGPEVPGHSCAGELLDITTATGALPGAGFRPDDPALEGAVILQWSAFDSWLVEDEPRVGHPHDPFKRISIHECSRQVEVVLEGTTLASSRRSLLLAETHLPPRYYVPRDDVRMELLVPSSHRTTCAYKGHASYWSVPGVADDVCWSYERPLDEAARVRDHVCFWSERTDLLLDGELQRRPVTPFSPPEKIAAEGLQD
jgi:uncharacterized protein (DUF427 family)